MIAKIAERLISKGWYLSTAESCTGGKLAASIIEYPGSSAYFDRGLIVYSNLAKKQELGVLEETLQRYGAVSDEVALEMVKGLFLKTKSEVVFSTTGLAGPNGDGSQKPIGLVYFGWGILGQFATSKELFKGNRQTIQQQATQWALFKIAKLICQK